MQMCMFNVITHGGCNHYDLSVYLVVHGRTNILAKVHISAGHVRGGTGETSVRHHLAQKTPCEEEVGFTHYIDPINKYDHKNVYSKPTMRYE